MNYSIPGLYNHTGLKILVLKLGVKKFGIKMCSNSYGLYFQSQVIKKSGVKEGIQEGEKNLDAISNVVGKICPSPCAK